MYMYTRAVNFMSRKFAEIKFVILIRKVRFLIANEINFAISSKIVKFTALEKKPPNRRCTIEEYIIYSAVYIYSQIRLVFLSLSMC